MYSGKPPLISYTNGGTLGESGLFFARDATGAVGLKQHSLATSENCDPNLSFDREAPLKGESSPLGLGGGPKSTGSGTISQLPKPGTGVALSVCEVAGESERQSKEVNGSAKSAPSPTKTSASPHQHGHGHRQHFCRSPRCASNNPDYAVPAQTTPRKYLISKRHLLPGAICTRDPATLPDQAQECVTPQATSTGRPAKPIRKLEDVFCQPSLPNVSDIKNSPLTDDFPPTRIPKPPSAHHPPRLHDSPTPLDQVFSFAVSKPTLPASESYPGPVEHHRIEDSTVSQASLPAPEAGLFSCPDRVEQYSGDATVSQASGACVISYTEPREQCTADESSSDGFERPVEATGDGTENLTLVNSGISDTVLVAACTSQISEAFEEPRSLESLIIPAVEKTESELSSLEKLYLPSFVELRNSGSSNQSTSELESSNLPGISSALHSSVELEYVTEKLAQNLAFDKVEESSPRLPECRSGEGVLSADDSTSHQTAFEEGLGISSEQDGEGRFSKSNAVPQSTEAFVDRQDNLSHQTVFEVDLGISSEQEGECRFSESNAGPQSGEALEDRQDYLFHQTAFEEEGLGISSEQEGEGQFSNSNAGMQAAEGHEDGQDYLSDSVRDSALTLEETEQQFLNSDGHADEEDYGFRGEFPVNASARALEETEEQGQPRSIASFEGEGEFSNSNAGVQAAEGHEDGQHYLSESVRDSALTLEETEQQILNSVDGHANEEDYGFRGEFPVNANARALEETEEQDKPRSIASFVANFERAQSQVPEVQCGVPKFVRGKGRQLWQSDCRDSREVVFLKPASPTDRRAGDWMVDSILEGAISKLNPSGQGRVRVLVEAFESLMNIGEEDMPDRRASRVWCLNRMEKGEVDEDGEEFDDGDQRVDCYEVSGDGLQLRASMRLSLGGGNRHALCRPDEVSEIEMSAIEKVQDWDDDCRQSPHPPPNFESSSEDLNRGCSRSSSSLDGEAIVDQDDAREGQSENAELTTGQHQRRMSIVRYSERHVGLSENDRFSDDFNCIERTIRKFGCYSGDDAKQTIDKPNQEGFKFKASRRRRFWKASSVKSEPDVSCSSSKGSPGKDGVVRGTLLEPFHLLTEERGAIKEYQFAQKLEQLLAKEERLRNPVAQGLPWTTDEPQVLQKPAVKEQTRPVEFRHYSNSRAIERAEFDNYVSERSAYMKTRRQEDERLRQLIEQEEVKRLRREMVPRAQLMPFFDQPFIPTRSSKRLTVPKEPTFHNRQHKRAKCFVWQDQQHRHLL